MRKIISMAIIGILMVVSIVVATPNSQIGDNIAAVNNVSGVNGIFNNIIMSGQNVQSQLNLKLNISDLPIDDDSAYIQFTDENALNVNSSQYWGDIFHPLTFGTSGQFLISQGNGNTTWSNVSSDNNHANLTNLGWTESGHYIDGDVNFDYWNILNVSEITSDVVGLKILLNPNYIYFVDHQITVDTVIMTLEPTLISVYKNIDLNGHNITNCGNCQGFNGTNGVNGTTPIKGIDYFDGINGTNGINQSDMTKLNVSDNFLYNITNSAFVLEQAPNQNYGNHLYLVVGNENDDATGHLNLSYETYIEIPKDIKNRSVYTTLNLSLVIEDVFSCSNKFNLSVYNTNSFDENSIVWNNKPAKTTLIRNISITSSGRTNISLDISKISSDYIVLIPSDNFTICPDYNYFITIHSDDTDNSTGFPLVFYHQSLDETNSMLNDLKNNISEDHYNKIFVNEILKNTTEQINISDDIRLNKSPFNIYSKDKNSYIRMFDGFSKTIEIHSADGLGQSDLILTPNDLTVAWDSKGFFFDNSSFVGLGIPSTSKEKKYLCYDNIDGNFFYKTSPCGISRTTITLNNDVSSTAVLTFQNITGLSFPMTAGIPYHFYGMILYNTSVATIGLRVSVSEFPATTPTFLAYQTITGISATGSAAEGWQNNQATYDAGTASSGSIAVNGNIITIEGMIIPAVNGTFMLRFAPETATANGITIKKYSTVEYW